jgi:hypothetical protein
LVVEVRYIAEARRVGGWWAVDVVDVPGAHTQARRLDQVEAMARDVVSILTGQAPKSIQIEIVPVLDPTIEPVVMSAKGIRQASADLERRANTETIAASRKLRAGGLSLRDAGRLLGISHQRVAQLSPSKTTRNVPSRARSGAKD